MEGDKGVLEAPSPFLCVREWNRGRFHSLSATLRTAKHLVRISDGP